MDSIIERYPFIWPRVYASLRAVILPIHDIEQFLPDHGKILDVGCGYGLTTAYFALKHPERKVYGYELSEKRISVAKEIFHDLSNVEFVVKNLIEDTNLKYDVILAIDLLHHINDNEKEAFLKTCGSRLEYDGILLIKDIDKTPLYKYLFNYAHDEIMTGFDRLHFCSAQDLETMLNRNGFIIINKVVLKSIFYPHVMLVCKRAK